MLVGIDRLSRMPGRIGAGQADHNRPEDLSAFHHLRNGDRAAEQESLDLVASFGAKQGQLSLGLELPSLLRMGMSRLLPRRQHAPV